MIMRTLGVLSVTMCLAHTANAGGIKRSMKDFWEGSGGISNYNGAGAYEGQAAGYYTMGSLYARTPVKNTQLAAITMPSMKAGCGGINMHNGALSFIKSDAIKDTAENIANNSVGFITQLAISTISPVMAQKIEELQTWMQRVNAMNINSCETAATLVGGLWPKHERASANICSTIANSEGVFKDFAQARHECNANPQTVRDTIRKKHKDTADKLLVDDVNLAWKAMKDSGFFKLSDQASEDVTLAELFMTLSGTIVIHTNGDTPKYEFIAGRAAHNDIITVLMEGGDIKHHKCDEVDKCLNITREGGTHSIKSEEAFKGKVDKIVSTIIENILSNTALSEQEIGFLNSVGTPLYKTLTVYAAYSGAGALFELPVYIETIALQMLFEYLNDALRQVELASDQLIIASDDHLKNFKGNLRKVRKALAEREMKTHQTQATLMKLVDRTMVIEGILASNLSSSMAAAYSWSKDL